MEAESQKVRESQGTFLKILVVKPELKKAFSSFRKFFLKSHEAHFSVKLRRKQRKHPCRMFFKKLYVKPSSGEQTSMLNSYPVAVAPRYFLKKVFLKRPENPGKNTCVEVSFLIKFRVAGLQSATLVKKRLQHSCFLWILWNF